MRYLLGLSTDVTPIWCLWGRSRKSSCRQFEKSLQKNQGLLLEAERRRIHNGLATLEREIENKRAKLEENQGT